MADMRGIALVIAASGSAIAAVITAMRTKKTVEVAEQALEKIDQVRTEFNGHMEKFLAVKDELTETRVEGSYKQGQFDQARFDKENTSTR